MTFLPAHLDVKAPKSTPERTAFVLHGILGSGRNWRSFCRRLARAHPAWRFVLVDHRNHGDSHGAPPPHTLDACADDLARLADDLGVTPEVVIGHSYGGKVALAYARAYPDDLRNAWVLDSPVSARERDPGTSEIAHVLRELRDVPQPLEDREDVVGILTDKGFSKTLARWMTTNLRRADEGEGYVWRFDLDGVEEMLEHYFEEDFCGFLADLPPGVVVDVVRAERSDRWSEAEVSWMEENSAPDGPVRFHTLEGAGHWLHVDAPDALAKLLGGALEAKR
ncbi:MAG: alpha/beta fold hydrolase [Myxococcota bacterium]